MGDVLNNAALIVDRSDARATAEQKADHGHQSHSHLSVLPHPRRTSAAFVMEANIALFFNPRFRALDANGNPLSGATLTFYVAGTTTPASIYRDAALTTPASNPTAGSDASDAAGWFPQFFADESTICDVLLKTSAGVTIQTYEDAPFVGASLNTRERLTADRTYYVATTGSDVANVGLTTGSPFLTVQKAVDIVSALDFNGFAVTIQVADGTYAGAVVINGPCVGQKTASQLLIQGNTTTPGNVVFSNPSAATIKALYGARLVVRGVKFTGAAAEYLRAEAGGQVDFNACEFGATTAYHLLAYNTGIVRALGNYAIVGGAIAHWRSTFAGQVLVRAVTITITGTPAFTVAFAAAELGGDMQVDANTFTGSATGLRYLTTSCGVIYTAGGGATYLPGNTAGSATSPGVYA